MEDKKKVSKPTHVPGTAKGEEILSQKGPEPGRVEGEKTGADRPEGKSTARISSSVNPKEPIDPESPNLPPA